MSKVECSPFCSHYRPMEAWQVMTKEWLPGDRRAGRVAWYNFACVHQALPRDDSDGSGYFGSRLEERLDDGVSVAPKDGAEWTTGLANRGRDTS